MNDDRLMRRAYHTAGASGPESGRRIPLVFVQHVFRMMCRCTVYSTVVYSYLPHNSTTVLASMRVSSALWHLSDAFTARLNDYLG